MTSKLLISAGLIMALAACGKSGQQSAANGSAAAGGGSAPTAAASAGSGGGKLQPGLWEVNYETKATGANLPPAALAAMNHKATTHNCITPEQAAQPLNIVKQKDQSCDFSSFNIGGGRIRGSVTCAGKGRGGKSTMTMDGQYDSQSYAYTSTVTMHDQGIDMVIESKAVGHRVGECPAGGADNSDR